MEEAAPSFEIDASALWAAVDTMHREADEDREWVTNLGLPAEVEDLIVSRLRERSAQWIGEHMDRLVDLR